jgi:hypothetical protein
MLNRFFAFSRLLSRGVSLMSCGNAGCLEGFEAAALIDA